MYDFSYTQSHVEGHVVELPTWQSRQVEPSDFLKVLEEALGVLKQQMRGSSMRRADAADLLHAVEAASLLKIAADAGQEHLVPLAKERGASWAELGAAMGVARSTAQSRYRAAVSSGDGVRRRAPWEDTERAPRIDPPPGFTPSDDDVVRDDDQETWRWRGDLELGIQLVRSDPGFFVAFVTAGGLDLGSDDVAELRGEAREDFWRFAVGAYLGDRRADAGDARPGESLARLTERTRRA